MIKRILLGVFILACGIAVAAELQTFYMAKFLGLNNSVNPRLLLNEESPDMSNFTLDEIGSITERDVFGRYNATAGALGNNYITGLFKFYRANSKYFIACAGSKICQGISGVFTDITNTGITPTASTFWSACSFVQTGDTDSTLYLFNSSVPMQTWSGTGNTSTPAAYPQTNCAYGTIHKNRCWAARSDVYPYRLYFSSLNDPEDWTTTGGAIDLPGTTQEITGLISWGGNLYIFTETNIFVIKGSTPNDFSMQKTISQVGSVAPRSIKITDTGIMFLSRSGIYAFDGSTSYKLSDKIDSSIRGISNVYAKNACAVYDGSAYWIAYTPSGYNYNNTILLYDIALKEWYRFTGDACNVSYLERAYGGTDRGEIYGGSSLLDGIVYNMQASSGTESIVHNSLDSFSTGTTFNTVISSTPYVMLLGSFGNGADGSWVISTSKNINTDTAGFGGRTAADAVAYAMTFSVSAGAVTVQLANTAGLAVNDDVIIINMQAPLSGNHGLYELKKIGSVVANTSITLTTALDNAYDGTADKVMVQRVPNYNSVTINNGGTLTCSPWNGSTGGVLAFKAIGTVNVASGGSLTATAKGYRGGSTGGVFPGAQGVQGESYTATGAAANAANNGGGGGGTCGGGTSFDMAGGGGGFATAGQAGVGGANAAQGQAGGTYGDATFGRLYMGSGGGGGYADDGNTGGGAIYIVAREITVAGTLSSNGESCILNDHGGAGAGGSVFLKVGTASLGTTLCTATGGDGATGIVAGLGGYGGDGRITLQVSSITGTTDPAYTSYTLDGGYVTSGTLTSTPLQINASGTAALSTIDWVVTYPSSSTCAAAQTRTGETADTVFFNGWEAWTSDSSVFVDNPTDASVTFVSSDPTNFGVVKTQVPQPRDVLFYEGDDNASPNCVSFNTVGVLSQNDYADETIPIVDLSALDWISGWLKSPATGDSVIIYFGETNPPAYYVTVNTVQANAWEKWYGYIGNIAAADKDAVKDIRLKYIGDSSGSLIYGGIEAQNYYESGDVMTSTPEDFIQYRLILGTEATTDSPLVGSISLTYRPAASTSEGNFSSYYYTKQLDFNSPQVEKQFDSLYVECNSTTSNSCTLLVDYNVDSGNKSGTFSMPITSTADTVRIVRNFPASTYGKVMQLKFRNENDEATVKVKAAEIRYRGEPLQPR